jgi:hypothetical protein
MSKESTMLAWASDAFLRELLEQAGWKVRVVATHDGHTVTGDEMRDVFDSVFGEES